MKILYSRANVSRSNFPNHRRIDWRRIGALYAAMALMITIRVWNKYVFNESSVFIWGLFFVAAAVLVTKGRFPKHFYFPNITFLFLFFIFYAWVRLDDLLYFDLSTKIIRGVSSGFTQVAYLVIYYLLFISSVLIYAKIGRLSTFFWFLTCMYTVALIVQYFLNIQELQGGYNLIPGFILIPFLPFVFFVPGADELRPTPILISILCLLLFVLIGSRTASITVIVFLGVLYAWPWITKNKIRYNGTFVALCAVLIAFYFLYMIFGVINPDYSPMVDSSFQVFNKAIGTGRPEIWAQLLELISRNPLWGYGTDASTLLSLPLFVIGRSNLSAHSVYIEILYRLGIIGFLSFTLLLFMVWRLFWKGREQLVVRVTGSFLISIMFFSSTGTFLFFTEMSLRSGLAWIALGMGAGACLRATSRND